MSETDAASRQRHWEAWLGRGTEPALDAEVSIIDAHHHLWDRGGQRYLASEFVSDAVGHHLVGSVYVECLNEYRTAGPEHLRSVGEVDFARQVGTGPGSDLGLCVGIVGAADLATGALLSATLDACREAGGVAFKGIRYVTAWDASPAVHGAYPTRAGMLAEPAVLEGARQLAAAGLSLDVWVYFHQLDEVAALAAKCPELMIAVNHCGGPIGVGPYEGRRDAVFAAWKMAIKTLARHPRVVMKFGGLGMRVAGFGWRRGPEPPDSAVLAAAWRPYFEVCLEAFGADRLMFESNFPVDRYGCSYRSLWNAFKRLAVSLAVDERAALFAQTAADVYRLPLASRQGR